MSAKEHENLFFLQVKLLKVVSYFENIETLMARSGSDRIRKQNFGNIFCDNIFLKIKTFFFETFANLTKLLKIEN